MSGCAATLVTIALLWLPSSAAAQDAAVTESEAAAEPDRPWTVESALFFGFTQQQIEGPNRDDRVVDDGLLAAVLTATYRIVDWFEAGLYLHFDVGSTERTVWSRPDDTGEATPVALIEGRFWELWIVILARFVWGPAFFELGWAPLIARHDTTRDDLPNESGQTDGNFIGSRAVAFLLGVGVRVPLAERLDLTVRLEARIRYLIQRGGEDLADEEEFGQMALSPFIGVAYSF